jgi:hydrogenase expression/formation protein HypC
MCLAIPGKVIQIEADGHGVRMGKTDFGGILKQVCLEYTPDVQCGDYVLVHVGFALGKVDEAEAARTYKLLDEMNQLSELEVQSPILVEPIARSVPGSWTSNGSP